MVCRSLSIKKIVLLLFFTFNSFGLEKVGEGLLTFTIFNFEIYNLELYTDKKIQKFDELKKVQKYKMVFTFKKDIKAKYLKSAWSESKSVFPVKGLGKYFDKLKKIQPDMNSEEKIIISASGEDIEFSFPKNKLSFKNKILKQNIPWIWLGNNEVGEKLAPQIFKE